MPEPAAPLVPVTSETKDDVKKTDDTGNRAARTGGNVFSWAGLIAILNNRTSLNLTAEEAVFVIAVLSTVTSYVLNLLEYHNIIPPLKPKEAVYAPPKDTAGNVLGQVKP
jgi:hypothetical protein